MMDGLQAVLCVLFHPSLRTTYVYECIAHSIRRCVVHAVSSVVVLSPSLSVSACPYSLPSWLAFSMGRPAILKQDTAAWLAERLTD